MEEKIYSPQVIEDYMALVFKKLNTPKKVYAPLIKGLVETSLRGVDSHGIRLFPHYIEVLLSERINKHPKYIVTKTSASTAIFDADHTFGMTAGTEAMKLAMKLAKKSGTGIVAVRNSSHFGAAATYGLMAARKDMIGMAFTNTESLVVPFNGKTPFLGTNPICFAVPVEGEEPFCLDMATSLVSRNKILFYKSKGMKMEPGWAVDEQGQETLDPENAKGLLSIGSYKGYGLGLMVEILCSMLTGMEYGPNITKTYSDLGKRRKLGHVIIAIDIARFQKIELFKKRMRTLVTDLRNWPAIDGKTVMVPNDPEKQTFKKRSNEGIPVGEYEIRRFAEVGKLAGLKNGELFD